jgi:general secretion pathway protein C
VDQCSFHGVHHNLTMLSTFQRSSSRSLMVPWVTALLWLAAAASMVFWVLKWPAWQPVDATVVLAATTPHSNAIQTQTGRALGHVSETQPRAEQPASTSFKLLGVIASASGQGSALIAIDGQPPRAFRMGQIVQDGWQLQSLTPKQARLSKGSSVNLLELSGTN